MHIGSEAHSEVNSEYHQHLIDGIKTLICQMVGHTRQYPSDFKGVKAPGPEPYGGKNDIEVFDNWLRNLLRFFQLNKMCGYEYDMLLLTKHLSQFN